MSDTFSGHDLETGILQRVRRWRDALPILILLDALRVAGSPLYVGLSLVAVLISRGVLLTAGGGGLAEIFAGGLILRHPLDPLVIGIGLITDFRWLGSLGWADWLQVLAVVAIWSLPAAAIARAGACYAAGREQSFLQNVSLALRRLHWLWLLAIVPVAGILGLSMVLVAVGLLARAGRIGMWLSEFGALLALPVMILIGLLAVGSFAAVPLAWAAMVIEKRCDMFDSLSRGYEYLYRRPVHLLFCCLCGYVLVGVVLLLALAVSSAALVLASLAIEIGSGGGVIPYGFQLVVSHLPLAVAMSAFWGLTGATYLLMRQSANQKEIEDIAVSPIDRREAELPILHVDAAEATSR